MPECSPPHSGQTKETGTNEIVGGLGGRERCVCWSWMLRTFWSLFLWMSKTSGSKQHSPPLLFLGICQTFCFATWKIKASLLKVCKHTGSKGNPLKAKFCSRKSNQIGYIVLSHTLLLFYVCLDVYVHVCVFMYVCVNVCACVCVCVYTCASVLVLLLSCVPADFVFMTLPLF